METKVKSLILSFAMLRRSNRGWLENGNKFTSKAMDR